MFERFTERARQVVVLAQDEARELRHNYIGTEHLLLGLLREEEGVAARVLDSLDVTILGVRAQVERIVGQGDEVTTGQIPFTPRAKRVLELALREALSLGNNWIGTEHVLLGVVRENKGVAARILLDFDADAEKIRNEIVRMLPGSVPPPRDARERLAPALPASPPVAPEVVEEIKKVRAEKEEAIEAEEHERAAGLRHREWQLVRAASELERAWRGEVSWQTLPRSTPRPAMARPGRARELAYRSTAPFVAGAAVFGVAAAIGLLVGWLIFG